MGKIDEIRARDIMRKLEKKAKICPAGDKRKIYGIFARKVM